MPTIRWADLNCTKTPGQLVFRDMLIAVNPEHIKSWQEDPDGRFGMQISAQPDGAKTAELVKSYPSL